MATYVSINVGEPKIYECGGISFASAVRKQPAKQPLLLSALGMEGDKQSDTKHHGGAYKAAFFYEADHYGHWADALGLQLSWGALGETITTRGFSEEEVCIGDIYRIGDATVQITQPRQPCFKLGCVTGEREFPVWMEESGRTGIYAKVLTEGRLLPSGKIQLVEKDPMRLSVMEVNRLLVWDKQNWERMEWALQNKAISPSMVRIFTARLAGETEISGSRLYGPLWKS